MSQQRYRIAYLVTHPIQYQAPLLRLISVQPDFDLMVFFQSDASLRGYQDLGFGRSLKWDVPLVDGYKHEFLPGLWRHGSITAQRPVNWGFMRRLRRSRFDVLWVHGYSRWVNWIAIACAKAHRLKVLVRDDANLFSADRSKLRQLAKRAFFKILALMVDGFLAIGSANREYYLAQGIAAKQIFDMPYCVDNDFFAKHAADASASRAALRTELGLEPHRPIILYASKFEARKRPADLLDAYERAAKRLQDSRRPYLLFAGDGELRPVIEREARERVLDDVRLLGFRNQTELPALYDLCDVFVLPSLREPWGLVVNEVMAAGRAVVVSDQVGCARDLVKNGVNGFVFPAGDVAALADALVAVLADPQAAHDMGLASRGIIGAWSLDSDIGCLRAILRNMIGRERRR